MHLNHEFKQLALTDCSGRILNTIFTHQNGVITINVDGKDKDVNLYELPEFATYRDKFLDYNFVKVVMNWIGTYSKKQIEFLCVINETTGSVTFTMSTDNIAEFNASASHTSILYGLLQTNYDFYFYHGMDEITHDTINQSKMARQ